MDRPEWWDWELAYTEHVEARLLERGVSDIELRTMLDRALELVPGSRAGRWLVRTRHASRPWVVVVEPDPDERLLYVVTVHPKDKP